MTEPEHTASRWRVTVVRHVGYLSSPFEWLVKLVRIVESAIPIGLLRRSEIDHVVRRAYEEVPDFYDPSKYPIRYEEQLLPILEGSACESSGRRLLDLYCGHGREAEIFARAGFKVVAVDAQSAAVERAREYAARAGFDAEFTTADIDNWQPSDSDWDVVYTSLWMYSTIPDREARIAWLKRLSSWVASGGCLVVSYTPQATGPGAFLRHALAWLFRLLTLNERRPEFGDRFHTGLFWHDFTSEAFRAELEAAGVKILDSLEIGGGTPCNFYLLRRGHERTV